MIAVHGIADAVDVVRLRPVFAVRVLPQEKGVPRFLDRRRVSVLRQPQPSRSPELTLCVAQHLLDQVAAVKDTLVFPAQSLFYFLHEHSGLLQVHGVVAIGLQIEAKQLVVLYGGVIEVVPDLFVHAGAVGKVVAAPQETGCLGLYFGLVIGGIVVARSLRGLVDDADNAVRFHGTPVLHRFMVAQVENESVNVHFGFPLLFASSILPVARPPTKAIRAVISNSTMRPIAVAPLETSASGLVI